MKSLDSFYQDITEGSTVEPTSLLPNDIQKEIGHFNVFDIKELLERMKGKPGMPYDRRAYYKISLIRGKNKRICDKIIEIEKQGRCLPLQKFRTTCTSGPIKVDSFCVYERVFIKNKSGIDLDECLFLLLTDIPFSASDEELLKLNDF